MSHFKTPKGTLLPFLNLKGKEYLQVAHRIVWFREDHPDWRITPTIVKLDDVVAVVEATIQNTEGTSLASAHKMQTAKGFPGGYLEKAESGAVGRALAFLGYGTAFAQELEESLDDLSEAADSPLPRPPRNEPTPADPFGQTQWAPEWAPPPAQESTDDCKHIWLKDQYNPGGFWCKTCKVKKDKDGNLRKAKK